MDSVSCSIHTTESRIFDFLDSQKANRGTQIAISSSVWDLYMARIHCAEPVKMFTNSQLNKGPTKLPLEYGPYANR